MLFKRNNEVAEKASEFWTNSLQSPYRVVYQGNIGFKLEKTPVLSEREAMVFKSALTDEITKGLRKNGYLKISRHGDAIERSLTKAGVKLYKDTTEEVMYIEEDSEIYFYASGMKKAKRI